MPTPIGFILTLIIYGTNSTGSGHTPHQRPYADYKTCMAVGELAKKQSANVKDFLCLPVYKVGDSLKDKPAVAE